MRLLDLVNRCSRSPWKQSPECLPSLCDAPFLARRLPGDTRNRIPVHRVDSNAPVGDDDHRGGECELTFVGAGVRLHERISTALAQIAPTSHDASRTLGTHGPASRLGDCAAVHRAWILLRCGSHASAKGV
ncbi:hypothetical protein [Xanthomonas maliensis]|uniref:hypothetical protein n=1 Tax=Xanthomonas maliensis TaxID=1321368 RepID=UPI0012646D11|nr:hypothetical protein [Xanthomonas maliensis]